jgi:hypothetical protein
MADMRSLLHNRLNTAGDLRLVRYAEPPSACLAATSSNPHQVARAIHIR